MAIIVSEKENDRTDIRNKVFGRKQYLKYAKIIQRVSFRIKNYENVLWNTGVGNDSNVWMYRSLSERV